MDTIRLRSRIIRIIFFIEHELLGLMQKIESHLIPAVPVSETVKVAAGLDLCRRRFVHSVHRNIENTPDISILRGCLPVRVPSL